MAALPVYNSRNRIWLQVVMWLVLAAGIAAAAGVSHWKAVVTQAHLQPASQHGLITLQIPVGWEVVQQSEGRLNAVVLADSSGRSMQITAAKLTRQYSPEEILEAQHLPQSIVRAARPFEVSDGRGLILQLQRAGFFGSAYETVACVTFRDGGTATIRMTSPQSRRTTDVTLVRQVAQSIRVNNPGAQQQNDDDSV